MKKGYFSLKRKSLIKKVTDFIFIKIQNFSLQLRDSDRLNLW